MQDYNRQVLVELTGPNVEANRQKLPPSRRAASARYFAGDWQALGRLLSREGLGGSYDIILASECIYNESTQRELLECIKQVGSACAVEQYNEGFLCIERRN